MRHCSTDIASDNYYIIFFHLNCSLYSRLFRNLVSFFFRKASLAFFIFATKALISFLFILISRVHLSNLIRVYYSSNAYDMLYHPELWFFHNSMANHTSCKSFCWTPVPIFWITFMTIHSVGTISMMVIAMHPIHVKSPKQILHKTNSSLM